MRTNTLPFASKLGGRAGVAFVVLAVPLVGYGFWSKPAKSAHVPLPDRETPYADGQVIRYSEGFAARAHIEFAAVAVKRLAPVVNVTGTVAFDPSLMVALGARVAGRIRRIHKLEGDTVERGDVLAEIESVELGKAQAAVMSARAEVGAAVANEKRELELSETHISSKREAELAVARAASARAELLAAEEKVIAMCGPSCGEVGNLKLVAPIAGKVIERNISRGQWVDATKIAFRIADLGRVWVKLAVFERQLGAIQVGDSVDLYAHSASSKSATGNVAYVGDVIDLETRTADVRIVVDQPDMQLRPGESVWARVHTAERTPAITIPRAAVTSFDGRPTVFLAQGEFAVEGRVVELGAHDAERVEVLRGLSGGDRVATSGLFALKSELFR